LRVCRVDWCWKNWIVG